MLHHANVLFAQNIPVVDLLSGKYDASRNAVERHHLFPKAYLNSIGLRDISITNQIANMAFIPWQVNMEITDTNSSEYWDEIRQKYGVNDTEMHLHALPQDWHLMNYTDFLTKHRQFSSAVIRDGFSYVIVKK